jgi:DNA topoisomerase VI subunit B
MEKLKDYLREMIRARENREQTKEEIELDLLREVYKMVDLIERQPEKRSINEMVEDISDTVSELDWATRNMTE